MSITILDQNDKKELKNDIAAVEEEVATLREDVESGAVDDIPDYVITEAESVIDRIVAAQKNRTFTFAAITDLHYGNAYYTDGIKHACQAMKYIDERIKLDAVAVLGDYTDGYPAEGFANAIGDFKAVNSVLDGLRFAPNFRLQGNHDYYAAHTALVNRFIQSYSDDVVWGSKSGGYFYRDFDEFKLRIICVNTTETGNANIGCSTEQYQWFVDSLNLTAKDDVEEWQILVLSHHPLDWYSIDSTYRFAYFLEGYKKGTSGTAGGIAYDFTDKNSATLIGNIHGHIHNLLTDCINKGNINTSNPTTVIRMCTPEACINRANQYDGWKENTAYNKTVNTAKDTSFVVYCVDLDNHVIEAICYGAGYDRKVNYLGAALTYTVTNNLTNVVSDNAATVVDEGTRYTANLTATEGDIISVTVTMGGEVIDAYSNGVVDISAVTGDIIITAAAKQDEEETVSYINQIPISTDEAGNVYNSVGYRNGFRLNSSGGETDNNAAGVAVTGFIPCKNGDTIYLKNVAYIPGGTSSSAYLCFYVEGPTSTAINVKEGLYKDNTYVFTDITTDPTTGYMTSFKIVWGSMNFPEGSFIRMSAPGLDSTSIITVNQPIE